MLPITDVDSPDTVIVPIEVGAMLYASVNDPVTVIVPVESNSGADTPTAVPVIVSVPVPVCAVTADPAEAPVIESDLELVFENAYVMSNDKSSTQPASHGIAPVDMPAL